jgi:hypothetical protein
VVGFRVQTKHSDGSVRVAGFGQISLAGTVRWTCGYSTELEGFALVVEAEVEARTQAEPLVQPVSSSS